MIIYYSYKIIRYYNNNNIMKYSNSIMKFNKNKY